MKYKAPSLIISLLLYLAGSSALHADEVKEPATLIFTSPSSIECFLKTHTISPDAKIVVIGKTTAKALPKDIKYQISKKKSIDSCMELALSL